MDQQQQLNVPQPSSVADLQQLSAMIAVIAANSPPSLPVSTTSIPSPQSAFAFLRPTESNSFATPPIANGLLSVSSDYHQNSPHLGTFASVTQSSSDQLASAAYNPYGCSFPATPAPPGQNTFLVEHFSKMLASTVDPCAILAKLQQQLAMADGSGGSGQRLLPHLPPQPSPSSSTPSFLMEENSRRHSFGDRTINMEQKYLAASPFKKEQDDLPFSLLNPSRKMSMGAHEYSGSGSAPPRKIRRRRPKSPTMNKPMVCVKSEVEEPCLEVPMRQQEEQRLMEQQMATPDDPTDPVMHSPPSSNLNLMGMSTSNAFHAVRQQQHQHQSKDYGCQEPRRPPPSSSLGKDVLDSQGDPKKCLVCADRATGYNFNVITCESCKAFFRRNALRPKNGKDFKCPYTDQCEITTVSRRFCQKCRLKKCFDVGMKKEWILNDDQLKRRKNSRLNSGKGSQHNRSPLDGSQQLSPPESSVGSPPSPCSSVSNMSQHGGHSMEIGEMLKHPRRHSQLDMAGRPLSGDFKRPPGLFATLPSFDSSSSAVPVKMEMHQNIISPNSKPMLLKSESPVTNGVPHIGNYQSSLTLLQQQQLLSNDMTMKTPSFGISEPKSNATITLPIREYMKLTTGNTSAFTPQLPTHCAISTSGQYQQSSHLADKFECPVSSIGNSSMVAFSSTQDFHNPIHSQPTMTSVEMLSPPAYNTNPQSMTDAQLSQLRANQMQRMQYMEHTIKDALVNSPEEVGELPECYTSILHESMLTSEPKLNYELNSCEMRQLDIVKSAFSCMEEKVEPTKSVAGIVGKEDHTPAEILNIMDVVMRRVVKMAKKLPPFNDLSQDGKLSLLKAAMIDLLCLRGVSKLDTESQCWNAQALGENALVSMKKMFEKLNDPAQLERYMLFFLTLSASIRSNMVCMNLFATIVLFDHCQNLVEESDRVVGKRHYETHLNLLRRYLESTIGGEETPSVMATAIASLKQLQILSAKAATLFIGKVKAGESESLPMEFFKTTSAEGGEEGGEGTPASQETQGPAKEGS